MSTSPTAPLPFAGVSQYSTDFQSVLTRQVQIAQLPITPLQSQQAVDTSKVQLLGGLNSAVGALATSISALGAIGANKGLVASSSDPSISVQNTGATQPTSYTISDVQSLAATASETSLQGYPDSTTTAVSSAGNLQLILGNTSYSLTLGKGQNNLNGLSKAINASGAPVTASILTTGTGANADYLVVTANNGGATTLQVNDLPAAGAPVALLAHAQNLAESSVASYADKTTAAPVAANSTLQLVLGSTTSNITLAAGQNNLNGLVSAINTANLGVTATIATGSGATPYSLVVTANNLGATNLQLNEIASSGASTNLLASVNNNANQGSNAVFKLNGIGITETTNSINNVIPGVTFTLNSLPSTTSDPSGNVTLSLSSDTSQLSSALNTLVTNYNAVVTLEKAQTGQSGGSLTGDFAIRAVADDMRQLTTYQAPGTNYMSLAALGVNFADITGQMTFDPTALSSLTDSQLSDAFNYLGSKTTGMGAIGARFTQLSDPISGLIQTEESGFNSEYTKLGDRVATMNTNLSNMETALTAQLEKADSAVAELQTQQEVLSSSVESVDLALFGQNYGNAITSQNG